MSQNAPRIAQRNGQFYLQEHGNERQLQGQEIEEGQRYAADFQQKFPTGFQPDNPNSLNDAYRQYTGRDADAAGMAAHQRNPGGFAGAVDAIRYSPEAGAYRQSQLQTAIAGVPGGANRSPVNQGGPASQLYNSTQSSINTGFNPYLPGDRYPNSEGPGGLDGRAEQGGGVQSSIYTGYTPKYAMEGFDFSREQNTGKSAKDAFAYLSNQAPPPPQDKAGLGQWFQQYIQPGMDQLGHKVSSVTGDKFTYGNHEGTFEVDFARGADAPGGALAWQSDPINGGTANARPYVPVVGVPRPGTSTGGPVPYRDYIPFNPDPYMGQQPGGPIYGGDPQQADNGMDDYYRFLEQYLASQQGSI